MLASGKTSRLYKRLVYDDQIATDVARLPGLVARSASHVRGPGHRQPGRRPRDGREGDRRGAGAAPARTARRPTRSSARRTERLAGFVRGVERIGGFGGKSDILAQSQVCGGSPDFYRTRLERVKAATPADVGGAAKRWLSDGVYVLEVHPFPELAAGTAGADRTKPARARARRRPAACPRSSGRRCRTASSSSSPSATRCRSSASACSSTPATPRTSSAAPGTASLAGDMLDEGTQDPHALADQRRAAAARRRARHRLRPRHDARSRSPRSRRTSTRRSTLFADVVLNPSFPQAELERLKKQQLAAIQQERRAALRHGAARAAAAHLRRRATPTRMPLTGSGTEASVATHHARATSARFHADLVQAEQRDARRRRATRRSPRSSRSSRQLFAGWKGGDGAEEERGARSRRKAQDAGLPHRPARAPCSRRSSPATPRRRKRQPGGDRASR